MTEQLTAKPYTAWQLIKVYWQSEQRLIAYIFLISVIFFTFFIVALDLTLNNWINLFYDALQDYDKRSVIDLLMVFCLIAGTYIITAVYRYYIQSILGLRWRRWLTDQFLNRWLTNRGYYYLETFEKHTDNPDQRIQEDVGSLVNLVLGLLVGFISSIATFFVFIYVLWTLSSTMTIPLGRFGQLHIPGYLVWAAIIYAGFGTYFTFRIGSPLTSLNFEQQRREADFRFAAIDLRTHSEHVALYRGEAHEKGILGRLFIRVLDNWYAIIVRQKLLLWLTAGYNQIAVIVPMVVVLPNYFSKVFRLGGFMQALRAFGNIQESLSFFVNSYTSIAELRAVIRRLLSFLNHLHEVEQTAHNSNQFVYGAQTKPVISVKALTIRTPDQQILLHDINQDFLHGQNYLLKGPSGIGKSTFVRTVAGIWPFGSGSIDIPSTQHIMYLPQRPFMPIGSLLESLQFPDFQSAIREEDVAHWLNEIGLKELTNHLNETAAWSLRLSPGEQQRVALIRVLVHKPDWVFFDESTSALDINLESHFYQILKQALPKCSIISVGHRPSLEAYHDNIIDMNKFTLAAMV